MLPWGMWLGSASSHWAMRLAMPMGLPFLSRLATCSVMRLVMHLGLHLVRGLVLWM